MSVLVDTPVWSLALRRKNIDLSVREKAIVLELEKLVRSGKAQLLGLVRQEVLSGIRDEDKFRITRERLRAFPDTVILAEDFEEAASLSNICRRKGITGSTVDMLICAVALHHHWQIFSADRDFLHYAKVIPIQMFALS